MCVSLMLAKTGTDRHDEEPRPKHFVFDNAAMEEDDGIDVDSLAAKREDQLILYHAILVHDLTETYSSRRLKLSEARFVAGQLMGVDMSEMVSPERVTSVCKQYGLIPGQAMDIKNGLDFDVTADRKKAWDSVLQDKRKLAIGSPPCTFFSRLQELNKYMYILWIVMGVPTNGGATEKD